TDQGSVTNAQLAQQADLHPMTPDQIAGFQDSVNEAQVTVDNAQLGVTQTNLLAPQAGVVLQVNGKVNETSSNTSAASATGTAGTTAGGSSTGSTTASASVSSGSAFILLANASQLAVNANIPEADAAKIQLGQRATIAFPATNTTATGSVTQITPQGTPTNNVVEFPVQVSLDTAPPGVDVGSTANLTIAAASATDVLEVPNLAVTSLGNRHTVTVRRNGTDTVVPVTTGLVGDTQTEITSGVQPGDMVVLPSTGATSTGSTPATSANTGAGFPRTGG
ncbi:HlyD family efflux transporter periplasmic adaptor subunit, partial [Pseudonocardia sp.]|uniref:efflux RND transporter periplasmic adaptor subunit n=1 Tax=Pseudonocardia sp. TaxID=60912 RepID=UPI002632D0CC